MYCGSSISHAHCLRAVCGEPPSQVVLEAGVIFIQTSCVLDTTYYYHSYHYCYYCYYYCCSYCYCYYYYYFYYCYYYYYYYYYYYLSLIHI